jgi:DNA-directed RNA polymerase specialized sigma24 family protein
MNIDVKKLLYKNKQMSEARRNALIAVDTLEERDRRYQQDENWFIRSSLPSNRVESEFIAEEDTVSRIKHLRWVVGELNIIIDAVSRASMTLNEDQRELIHIRYFDDNTVVYVCEKMHIKDTKYNYTHRIALEAMTACLNPLCITEQYLDSLLFSPYKERLNNLNKPRKIKDFERIMSGFVAS